MDRFRVKSMYSYGWDTISEPSSAIRVLPQDISLLSPPTIRYTDASSITVEWKSPLNDSVNGYLLRYRAEHDLYWTDVKAMLTSTMAKKNGLAQEKCYYFAVKPLIASDTADLDNNKWEFSLSSVACSVAGTSSASLHSTALGYTTLQGREDWLKAHDITHPDAVKVISTSLMADKDLSKPLYYWQLFSIMGFEKIRNIVSTFYDRVYNDMDEIWFREAFERISDVHHHISTQTAFWVDTFGGGRYYHGADGRLNFHHSQNAASVMTERGAKRWMHHMRLTLKDHLGELNALDRRILPCLVDFLKTKMYKYSYLHSWNFDPSDFEGIIGQAVS